jgi:uncharacterized protein (TIGR02246 family)
MKYISAFLFLFFISTITLSQTPQMARDAQTIQKRMSDLLRTWNELDSKQFSLLFSEDADFTNSSGTRVYGRRAIEQLQGKYFSTFDKSAHLKIIDKKIRYITNDITSVDAQWEIEGAGSTKSDKGFFVCIMTRSDDDWVITVMHIMILSTN